MKRFSLRSEVGQTAVEYVLALAVLAIGCLLALLFFSSSISGVLGLDGGRSNPFEPPSATPLPTSAKQCQDGGWMNFPSFTSEAECLNYVKDLAR